MLNLPVVSGNRRDAWDGSQHRKEQMEEMKMFRLNVPLWPKIPEAESVLHCSIRLLRLDTLYICIDLANAYSHC